MNQNIHLKKKQMENLQDDSVIGQMGVVAQGLKQSSEEMDKIIEKMKSEMQVQDNGVPGPRLIKMPPISTPLLKNILPILGFVEQLHLLGILKKSASRSPPTSLLAPKHIESDPIVSEELAHQQYQAESKEIYEI